MESERGIRKAKIEYDNWMVGYKLKPELERVVWRSKLYSKQKVVTKDQSLVERTENQVDVVSIQVKIYLFDRKYHENCVRHWKSSATGFTPYSTTNTLT